MSRSTLNRLPPEIHHGISFYLTNADSISLSLTCKRLYKTHARQWRSTFSRYNLWSIISADDYAVQKTILKRWTARNLVLPRLSRWIQCVIDETCLRDEHPNPMDHLNEWEICVGCARFKVFKDGWGEGWEYEDVMNGDAVFDCWIGEDWHILQRFVLDGQFCGSCIREWGKLRAQWKLKLELRRH